MKRIFLLGTLLALQAHAGSVYLCKAYSGGAFWSSAHCSVHNALIDRIVSVPDTLPFDQQVRLAEQDRASAAAATARTNTVIQDHSAANSQAECKALDAQITQYDAMARQPQSGQMQDWISAQRKKARDRQFQIRC